MEILIATAFLTIGAVAVLCAAVGVVALLVVSVVLGRVWRRVRAS